VKYGTRQYGMALILMVLLGTFFASANNAHAFLSIVDQTMNPMMAIYTVDDWFLQRDKIGTNVQRQTAEALNSGTAYPLSAGKASAGGTSSGIGASSLVAAVTGNLNLKTAMKAAVKSIITNVLNDISTWARGGFKGKPNFIADWKGMMQASLMDASAEFISTMPVLSQFCSPQSVNGPTAFFGKTLSQAKPTYAKYTQKSFQPTNKCNIETVVTRARGIATGYKNTLDKFGKSWDPKAGSVMAATLMDPANNMMGLYFQAKDEASVRTRQNTKAKKMEASANSGFLNISDGCVGAPDPVTKEKFCPAKMAGEFVKDNLSATGLGQFDDLIDSNDLADLFSALAANAFGSITQSISGWLEPMVGDAIKGVSF
jgi:hypothetical protein